MEIEYSFELPTENDLYELYEALNWNAYLNLPPRDIQKALENSYYIVSAYYEGKLVGTGRIVSDGVMNAYICGLGISPQFQRKGIGTTIFNKLISYANNKGLHIQFFCEDHLLSYYEKLGFTKFANGMKK